MAISNKQIEQAKILSNLLMQAGYSGLSVDDIIEELKDREMYRPHVHTHEILKHTEFLMSPSVNMDDFYGYIEKTIASQIDDLYNELVDREEIEGIPSRDYDFDDEPNKAVDRNYALEIIEQEYLTSQLACHFHGFEFPTAERIKEQLVEQIRELRDSPNELKKYIQSHYNKETLFFYKEALLDYGADVTNIMDPAELEQNQPKSWQELWSKLSDWANEQATQVNPDPKNVAINQQKIMYEIKESLNVYIEFHKDSPRTFAEMFAGTINEDTVVDAIKNLAIDTFTQSEYEGYLQFGRVVPPAFPDTESHLDVRDPIDDCFE